MAFGKLKWLILNLLAQFSMKSINPVSNIFFLLSTLLVKNFLLVLWRENYKVLGENEAEPAWGPSWGCNSIYINVQYRHISTENQSFSMYCPALGEDLQNLSQEPLHCLPSFWNWTTTAAQIHFTHNFSDAFFKLLSSFLPSAHIPF